MDTLSSLKIFRSIADSGSFTAAAARLGISTAMASKHVAHLERQVRARLLNRSSRHVSLTEAGAAYYQHCREALDILDGAAAELSEGHDEPSGTLKLTAPVWCATGHFARILAGYCSRFPQVTLDLHLSNHKVDLVHEGFDLALRVTNEPSANLIVRPLCKIFFHAVATPSLVRAQTRREGKAGGGSGLPGLPGVAGLSGFPAIAASYLPPSNTLPMGGPDARVDVRVSTILKSDNTNLAHECVLAGLGAALLPQWLVADDLESGRLVPLLPGCGPVSVTLHAAYTNRMYLTPKVRSLIDFLADALRQEPVGVEPPPAALT